MARNVTRFAGSAAPFYAAFACLPPLASYATPAPPVNHVILLPSTTGADFAGAARR